jgi:hypothetical protein
MVIRVVVLVLLFAFSALGGASSAATAGVQRHHSVLIPGGRGHLPIAGWAFIGRGYELSHATASLRTLRGRPIPGGSTRTGPTGRFTLSPLARDVPRTFVVMVRGGFIAGRRQPRSFAFSTVVHRRDLGRIVYVGLASTVLRGYLRGHPRVAERTAATRVRRMLGIPAWHNLGFDLYNISPRWYSAAKVKRVAAAYGGLRFTLEQGDVKKLVAALVRAVARGRRRGRPPFAGATPALPAQAGLVRKRRPRAHAAQGTFVLQNLAAGVISAAGGQGAGWMFNQVGFTTTPAYVAQIQGQLNQLAADMSRLKDQVSAVNSAVQETYYGSLTSSLTDARAALDTAMEDMSYVAGDTNDANRMYWAQQFFERDIKPIATNQKPWGSTLVLINNVIAQPPPGVNPLGLQGAIYLKSQGPFWTLSKSQQMFEIVDFWTQYAVEALDVYLEYEHQVGSQQYCNNPPTATGCPLQKWVEYTQTLSNQARATLHDPQGRPLKPLPYIQLASDGPKYGYTIDIRSGLMWCTPCEYYPGGSADTLAHAQYLLSIGYYTGFALGAGLQLTPSFVPYKDFAVPNASQLAGLMQSCGCDQNHPTGIQWLVNNADLDPSWLYADKNAPYTGTKPAYPGHVYMWTTDVIFPGAYIVPDLLRGTDGVGISGGPNYYLPARTPLPSEGPYYP